MKRLDIALEKTSKLFETYRTYLKRIEIALGQASKSFGNVSKHLQTLDITFGKALNTSDRSEYVSNALVHYKSFSAITNTLKSIEVASEITTLTITIASKSTSTWTNHRNRSTSLRNNILNRSAALQNHLELQNRRGSTGLEVDSESLSLSVPIHWTLFHFSLLHALQAWTARAHFIVFIYIYNREVPTCRCRREAACQEPLVRRQVKLCIR